MECTINTELRTITLEQPTSLKELYETLTAMFPKTWESFTIVKEEVPKNSLFKHIQIDPLNYNPPYNPPVTHDYNQYTTCNGINSRINS